MACPLLIALPHGLGVSGVNSWAIRLAGAWADRGFPAALALHREPPGRARPEVGLHPGIERIDLTDLPPIESAHGDLSPYIARYGKAVRRLADRHGSAVVVSPNLLGDCYGIAAALCLAEPRSIRVVAWHHSPIEYNYRVLAHYEPVLARFVAPSDHIEAGIRERLPHRSSDVANIPYGVPVPPAVPRRPPLDGRAVRLIYTGRIDHQEKRVMTLLRLARELTRRGVDHELVVIGDGPASAQLDAEVGEISTVRRLPMQPAGEIPRCLDRSDAFVLASRYEGLSVSMLEAMARGCVPIVTRVESGVEQAIEPGRNGELAEISPEMDEEEVAMGLADAVERFLAGDPQAASESAWRTAQRRFSIDRHVDAVEHMLADVINEAPRAWPADQPCAFTASDSAGGSGTVPADGAARLARVLARLEGRRVVVHGTGEHTRLLAHVLAGSPAEIVAFADHDRDRQRSTLWNWPVVPPEQASSTGATDVVISSWINQQAIWGRRAEYEKQGLVVHRIYEEESAISHQPSGISQDG